MTQAKNRPLAVLMKAIDNVYGQLAYNLLSRNTSARQGVMEPPSESVDIGSAEVSI